MRRITFAIAGFLLALLLTFATRASALDSGALDSGNVTPESVAAMFKPALSTLSQKQVSIKILTPSFIFTEGYRGVMYAIPYSTSSDDYWIVLSGSPTCNGATACYYASVQGAKVGGRDVLSLEDDLVQAKDSYARVTRDRRDLNPPSWITLDNGSKAVFHPWFNFIHYTNAHLSWVDNGVRYQVVMKHGDKEGMVKMANSMH